MMELLSKNAGHLLEQPGLGRAGRVKGSRELVVHPNSILIYDLVGDRVRVFRMIHAARQWHQKNTDVRALTVRLLGSTPAWGTVRSIEP